MESQDDEIIRVLSHPVRGGGWRSNPDDLVILRPSTQLHFTVQVPIMIDQKEQIRTYLFDTLENAVNSLKYIVNFYTPSDDGKISLYDFDEVERHHLSRFNILNESKPKEVIHNMRHYYIVGYPYLERGIIYYNEFEDYSRSDPDKHLYIFDKYNI